MLHKLQHFLPDLLAGFLINLEIAAAAVLLALALGIPMTLLRRGVPVLRRPIGSVVRMMQAVPTYVVMFFMLNLLPRDLVVYRLAISGMTAVVLAQAVYLTAYVADNADDAFAHLERSDRERALLFLPNLLRGFVVVIMSSGFGAAVGVSEAVSVTMREAGQLPDLGDRLILFGAAIAFFAVIVGSFNLLIRKLIELLRQAVVQKQAASTLRWQLDQQGGIINASLPGADDVLNGGKTGEAL